MKKKIMQRIFATAVLLLPLAAGACDNPVEPGEDHVEAQGVVVLAGSQELLRVMGTTVTGGIPFAAARETDLLTVRFIDEDGEIITSADEDEYLRIDVGNPAVLRWTPAGAGAFTGRFTGVAAGTTSLRFNLMHGNAATGSGHPDAFFDVGTVVIAP